MRVAVAVAVIVAATIVTATTIKDAVLHARTSGAASEIKFSRKLCHPSDRIKIDDFKLKCAKVLVPTDWIAPAQPASQSQDQPSPHQISVYVRCYRPIKSEVSYDKKPTRIFVVSPGEPGHRISPDALKRWITKKLIPISSKNAEFCTIDHRGVGYSTPLTCATGSKQKEITELATAEQHIDCFNKMTQAIPFYKSMSSTNAALDMLHILSAVHESSDSIKLYGAAYGSYLIQKMLTLAPKDLVSEAVMESTWNKHFSIVKHQKQIVNVMEQLWIDCLISESCPLEFGLYPTAHVFLQALKEASGNKCFQRLRRDVLPDLNIPITAYDLSGLLLKSILSGKQMDGPKDLRGAGLYLLQQMIICLEDDEVSVPKPLVKLIKSRPNSNRLLYMLIMGSEFASLDPIPSVTGPNEHRLNVFIQSLVFPSPSSPTLSPLSYAIITGSAIQRVKTTSRLLLIHGEWDPYIDLATSITDLMLLKSQSRFFIMSSRDGSQFESPMMNVLMVQVKSFWGGNEVDSDAYDDAIKGVGKKQKKQKKQKKSGNAEEEEEEEEVVVKSLIDWKASVKVAMDSKMNKEVGTLPSLENHI